MSCQKMSFQPGSQNGGSSLHHLLQPVQYCVIVRHSQNAPVFLSTVSSRTADENLLLEESEWLIFGRVVPISNKQCRGSPARHHALINTELTLPTML